MVPMMKVKEHAPDAHDCDNVERMLWWQEWWSYADRLRHWYFKRDRPARARNKPEWLTYNGS